MSEITVHCHDQFDWFEDAWDYCPGCKISRRDWDRQHVEPLTLVTDTYTEQVGPGEETMTSTLPVTLIDPQYDLLHRDPAPSRAHANDAGIDLRAAVTRWIEPGEITGIPLGVAVAIPEGHVGLLMLRSSLGRKGIAMANSVGVIDAGYRGELIAQVTAWNDDPPRIEAGDRIAQLLVVPIVTPAVEVVDVLPESSDGRGTAGFGSTGR